MKKILLAFSILLSITLYGQAPQAMNAFPYIYGAAGYKNNSVDSNVVNFFGVKQGGNGKMVATPSFVSPKAISIGNGNTTGTSSIAIGNSISVSDSSIGLGSSSAKHQMVLGNNTIDSSYIYGHTVIQNGLSLPTIQNATGLATDANGNVIQSSSIIETGGKYGTFFNTQTDAPLGFIGVSKGMGITKKAGKFAFFNSVFDGTSLGEDTAFLVYGVVDTSNPDNATSFAIKKQNDTTYSASINSAGNLKIEAGGNLITSFDSANLFANNFLKLSVEDGKPIILFDDDDSNSNLQINGLPTGSASDTFLVMEGNQMKKRVGSGGGGGGGGSDDWKLQYAKYRVPKFYLDKDTLFGVEFKSDPFDSIELTARVALDDINVEGDNSFVFAFSANRLDSVQGVDIEHIFGGTISFDSLRTVNADFILKGNTNVHSLDLPLLATGAGGIFYILSNSGLTSLVVSSSLSGFSDYDLSGNALTGTSIDNFLQAIISGGDDGTGKTIDTTGGTNAAPTGALVTTLTGMNWTVLHN
jgi:hypothetical protein